MPHFDAVYHFAYSLTRDTGAAEDLVQDTFLQAYRSFHRFQLGTNCKAWLFKICKNRFIDSFREKRRMPPHQEIDLVEPPSRDRDTSILTYEKHGIDNEEIFLDLFGDEVNRFLAEMPEEFRRALLLCDIDGLSYQEIAEIVEAPIGTVRSRISRARAFLRERLQEHARELGYLKESANNGSERNELQ